MFDVTEIVSVYEAAVERAAHEHDGTWTSEDLLHRAGLRAVALWAAERAEDPATLQVA